VAAVSLDDKYTLERGRAYMTGIDALVRLPMLQHRRDQAHGLNTACFISGYRGSPLGGLDQALWNAGDLLKRHNIHFLPGINEDLGMTAVWGSQQVNLFPGANYDGVFGLWYGKCWRWWAMTMPANLRPCPTRAIICLSGPPAPC